MIEVYVDGASSGSPGKSGAGIFIKVKGEVFDFAIPLGTMTNHEAEFHAVLEAVKICEQQYPDEIVSFHSDSQLVVDAIEKKYVKNERFKPMLDEIIERAATFPYFFIKWIPSNQNKHADELAKRAIHLQEENKSR